MIKKKILFSAVLATLFVGCGSSSHHSTKANENPQSNVAEVKKTVIKVVDGYVIGAKVADIEGNVLGDTNESGELSINDTELNSTLIASGGYIDVNNNHKIDNDDIALPSEYSMKMANGGNVISPLTDLLAQGVNADKLKEILGVNDLTSDPYITNNVTLVKAIQIVWAVKMSGKEKEFINIINNSKIINNQIITSLELPNADQSVVTEKPTESKETPVLSKLPNADQSVVSEEATESKETPVSSKLPNADQSVVTVTYYPSNSIKSFGLLAEKLVKDPDLISFIDNVININVSNALNIETILLNQKKQIVSKFGPQTTNNSDNIQTTNSSDNTQTTNSSDNTQTTNSSDNTQTTNSSDNTQTTNSSDNTQTTNSSDNTSQLPNI